jgi:hypothetical protein
MSTYVDERITNKSLKQLIDICSDVPMYIGFNTRGA